MGFFGENINLSTTNVSYNTRSQKSFYNHSNSRTVRNGLETLRSLGPKIWEMVPPDIRKISSFPLFKSKIKKWVPKNCPCRKCKVFVPKLGFLWHFHYFVSWPPRNEDCSCLFYFVSCWLAIGNFFVYIYFRLGFFIL